MKGIRALALCAPWALAAGAAEPPPPSDLDRAQERLARQSQALDTLTRVVDQLNALAPSESAARELLRSADDRDGLLRALTALAAQRRRQSDPTPAAAAEPAAADADALRISLVYAQPGLDGAPASAVVRDAEDGTHHPLRSDRPARIRGRRVALVDVRRDGGTVAARLDIDGAWRTVSLP